MHRLLVLLLILALGCHTTPDSDAHAGPAPGMQATSGHGTGSEFDDAGAGAEDAPPPAKRFAQFTAASKPDASNPGEDVANPVRREVIYSANLQVAVVSVEDAAHTVQTLAEQAGGYLQQLGTRTITVRVPASRFDSTIEQIAALGEVVSRSITASDVTEEILDLNIRLDNATKARERLLDHLAHSKKIDDTIKIEAELARVSETIEQIEGKLRFMRSQISMSTILVAWIAETPVQVGATTPLGLPFQWIEELGDGLVAGEVEQATRKPGLFDFEPTFEPPANFIRYYSSRYRVEALSAEGLRIKVRRQANYDHGALSFWKDLARENLVRSRALAVTSERELGDDRTLITGTREVGGQTLGYMLLLKRMNKRVYSFEAWGPKATFDKNATALEASAKSLRR